MRLRKLLRRRRKTRSIFFSNQTIKLNQCIFSYSSIYTKWVSRFKLASRLPSLSRVEGSLRGSDSESLLRKIANHLERSTNWPDITIWNFVFYHWLWRWWQSRSLVTMVMAKKCLEKSRNGFCLQILKWNQPPPPRVRMDSGAAMAAEIRKWSEEKEKHTYMECSLLSMRCETMENNWIVVWRVQQICLVSWEFQLHCFVFFW